MWGKRFSGTFFFLQIQNVVRSGCFLNADTQLEIFLLAQSRFSASILLNGDKSAFNVESSERDKDRRQIGSFLPHRKLFIFSLCGALCNGDKSALTVESSSRDKERRQIGSSLPHRKLFSFSL